MNFNAAWADNQSYTKSGKLIKCAQYLDKIVWLFSDTCTDCITSNKVLAKRLFFFKSNNC